MMEGQQYIIQQQEDEEEGPREGELREQDRFLPIYNISKVVLWPCLESLRRLIIVTAVTLCQYSLQLNTSSP